MSRWGVLVLSELSNGTMRWGELRRAVEGISEKMLASTLRTLAGDGVVERRSFPMVPPHVEYSLTPLGRELMERMLPLLSWIADHADEIVQGAGETQPGEASAVQKGGVSAGTNRTVAGGLSR